MNNELTKKSLGEILVEKNYISDYRLNEALNHQKEKDVGLGQILTELGYITKNQLNEALAIQAGIKDVNLDKINVESQVISAVPANLVSKYNIFPFGRENGKLMVCMADPFNVKAIQEIRVLTGLKVERYFSDSKKLEKAIYKYYGSNVAKMLEDLTPEKKKTENGITTNGEISATKLRELALEPSLVNLMDLIIIEAIEARASDIHIEPFETAVKIKYRIDGLLIEKSPSPKKLQAAIISRIKIMAGMDISERFVPQDGHIEFMSGSSKVDIRVSTVPSIFGESVTMRILDRSTALIGLEELGMDKNTLSGFRQKLKKAHGIILVTGPTGSGKTTTLYSALNEIYSPNLKIITIEDPVEYQLDGIIQMPVNPRRGLTFARGLRHILRQDPDIVMVGEIRDKETADIAIRAAMTGHLVFSTLHTNDSAGAITRLIDMDVEPFLLASSLEAVLAQRLVRKLCPFCLESYTPDENLLRNLNNSIKIEPGTRLQHGKGCSECNGTGMKGRSGIFELLSINENLRKLIAQKPASEQIKKAAPVEFASMRHDGISKILRGITTPEELFRVTQAVED